MVLNEGTYWLVPEVIVIAASCGHMKKSKVPGSLSTVMTEGALQFPPPTFILAISAGLGQLGSPPAKHPPYLCGFSSVADRHVQPI